MRVSSHTALSMVYLSDLSNEEFVEKHEKLANIIASKVKKTHFHYDFKELLNLARTGIWIARIKFDPSKGNKFETYCRHRAVGWVLDEIRSNGLNIRALTRLGIQSSSVDMTLTPRDTDGETNKLADFLIDQNQRYRSYHNDLQSSLNNEVEEKEIFEMIIKDLNSLQKYIFVSYICNNQDHNDTAQILGLSSSRVSQIFTASRAIVQKTIHTIHERNPEFAPTLATETSRDEVSGTRRSNTRGGCLSFSYPISLPPGYPKGSTSMPKDTCVQGQQDSLEEHRESIAPDCTLQYQR